MTAQPQPPTTGEPPEPPVWDGHPLSDEEIARYTGGDEPRSGLREALAPFLRQAESEASRAHLEDEHFTGPGSLTVGDWRRLRAATRTTGEPGQPKSANFDDPTVTGLRERLAALVLSGELADVHAGCLRQVTEAIERLASDTGPVATPPSPAAGGLRDEWLQFVQRVKREDGGRDWWEAVSTDNPAVRVMRPTLEGAIRALEQKRAADRG